MEFYEYEVNSTSEDDNVESEGASNYSSSGTDVSLIESKIKVQKYSSFCKFSRDLFWKQPKMLIIISKTLIWMWMVMVI